MGNLKRFADLMRSCAFLSMKRPKHGFCVKEHEYL